MAFGLWLYDRTIGAVLLVLAALLSFSRVYAGTHSRGRRGGPLIGMVVAPALYLAALTRRLIETIAGRAGEIWDRLLSRLGPSSTA